MDRTKISYRSDPDNRISRGNDNINPRKLACLNGEHLRDMLVGASTLLEANVEQINALNVFPVPDGDTGTNMYLTLREIAESVQLISDFSASVVAEEMARSALRAGRGNSGVILSQFFKGISVGLEGLDQFGTVDWARCLRMASEYSYKAVGDPVEGTMLTVVREAADQAENSAGRSRSVATLMDKICARARDCVQRTPTMLPVLKQAGVVDAGGYGLFIVLEGARRKLSGGKGLSGVLRVPGGIRSRVVGQVAEEFLAHSEDELYGYCTQFLVSGQALNIEQVKESVEGLAKSTVVVGDPQTIKIHGHTENPDALLGYGKSLGTLSEVSVQDMDEQKQDFSVMHREVVHDVRPIGLVAIANGKGFRDLFTSLGVDVLVSGGDSMNPSVQDVVDGITACPSNTVIILPNNKNILSTASQAAKISDKVVSVVSSTTIPQGIAAVLNYSLEKAVDVNVTDMGKALSDVCSLGITEATRSVKLDGVVVEQGQMIAVLEDSVVAAGEDVVEVLKTALVTAGVYKDTLVTLYRGVGRSENQAVKDTILLEQAFPDAEFEMVFGGQAHYHYLVSTE